MINFIREFLPVFLLGFMCLAFFFIFSKYSNLLKHASKLNIELFEQYELLQAEYNELQKDYDDAFKQHTQYKEQCLAAYHDVIKKCEMLHSSHQHIIKPTNSNRVVKLNAQNLLKNPEKPILINKLKEETI